MKARETKREREVGRDGDREEGWMREGERWRERYGRREMEGGRE